MALTIEDGTVVAGADSFATVAQIRAFAANRGLTLPTDDGAVEVLARRAVDYLLSMETRYAGARSSPVQTLPFPRQRGYIRGLHVAYNIIAPEVVNAQCAIACTLQAVDLMPVNNGRGQVTVQRTDVIETHYSERSYGGSPTSPLVDTYMAPLLIGQGTVLTVVRV